MVWLILAYLANGDSIDDVLQAYPQLTREDVLECLMYTAEVTYPPDEYAGLIVLRHPRPTLVGTQNLIRQIAQAIHSESPVGQLWIVEPGRIRIHGTPKQA